MSAQVTGEKPELAWLPLDKLTVDKRYQRGTGGRASKKLIERIANNLRWARFQTILVTHDTDADKWIVIDGQHRVEACRLRRDITHVPAIVFKDANVVEAAQDFIAVNRDRVKIAPIQIHHAMLAAKDERAQVLEEVCKKAGVSIPRYPIMASSMKIGQTLAVNTIYSCIGTQGKAIALSVLSCLAAAYRQRPGCIRAGYIRAVAWLLTDSTATPPTIESILAVLAAHSQQDLDVDALEVNGRMNMALWKSLAEAIRHLTRVDAEGGVTGKTSLRSAMLYLKEEGFEVSRGSTPGTYRLGDDDRQSPADILAFADRMRLGAG